MFSRPGHTGRVPKNLRARVATRTICSPSLSWSPVMPVKLASLSALQRQRKPVPRASRRKCNRGSSDPAMMTHAVASCSFSVSTESLQYEKGTVDQPQLTSTYKRGTKRENVTQAEARTNADLAEVSSNPIYQAEDQGVNHAKDRTPSPHPPGPCLPLLLSTRTGTMPSQDRATVADISNDRPHSSFPPPPEPSNSNTLKPVIRSSRVETVNLLLSIEVAAVMPLNALTP